MGWREENIGGDRGAGEVVGKGRGRKEKKIEEGKKKRYHGTFVEQESLSGDARKMNY